MRKKDLKAWQKDPNRLKTSRVQYWTESGVMMTAQLPLERAKTLVREGRCFVISDQAIGQLFSDNL